MTTPGLGLCGAVWSSELHYWLWVGLIMEVE